MTLRRDKKDSFFLNRYSEPRSSLSIDDPVNSDHWRCAVTMGVEKTTVDNYALKEFISECVKGRRQEISFIDYETTILKILSDFANGEVPYKYKLLLNFTSLFEEAAEFYKNKVDIPTEILVKIIKALLFHIKDESSTRLETIAAKITDPIKAMAERPSNVGEKEKKKDLKQKGAQGPKVRPPSITKEETNLLKRGERAKDDQCIDDAPRNAYFKHYVLLTGFYNPDFPVELIKAGVPLHAVLCVDTSRSGVNWQLRASVTKYSRRNTEIKSKDLEYFWGEFLKKLWNPQYSNYFRDTIFQMYVPRKITFQEECLKKYLYKEISYLMYDLSDLKRKLNNYLNHIRLWDVTEKNPEPLHKLSVPEFLPSECITVPIILQCMMDALCLISGTNSSLSILSVISGQKVTGKTITPSMLGTHGSCFFGHDWEIDLLERGESNLLNLYYKLHELDIKYGLDQSTRMSDPERSEDNFSGTDCGFEVQICGENLREALESSDTTFHMLWSKHKTGHKNALPVDYCLYARLMTKVVCSYEEQTESFDDTSFGLGAKSAGFETILNVGHEMQKPHFTVTDGSRSIIKSIPYNMKSTCRDFFCPEEFKVVTPEKLKASSAPQFRVTPGLKVKELYTSEILLSNMGKNPYDKLKGFVNNGLFSNTTDFDCLELLSRQKLLESEKANWLNYNCMDHIYCAFNDTILLMLHNRIDHQNFQHETFNQKLRTVVGLRDFYDYIQEDEEEWLTLQEESYQAQAMLSNKVIESNSLRDFENSDFWLTNSIKYKAYGKRKRAISSEVRIAYSSMEKMINPNFRDIDLHPSFIHLDDEFEGFDLGNMAVQYSGLKTSFYSGECVVAVQLIERLYGNQDLGVHVTQASHTLHLHSFVCPEPHVLEPFTFHITYNNGIIVAFSRRFVERVQVIAGEKSRPNTPNAPETEVPEMVEDEDFRYDMAGSLPNGLCFRTVRRVVQPCYIKQYYVGKKGRKCQNEKSRLFLPNGIIIVMMTDDTVKILKPNASIITAKLKDLVREPETGGLTFTHYRMISEEGYVTEVENGNVKSLYRHRVFQNKEWSSNRTFYRRHDGTTYLLQNDGSFCVQYVDGTKMLSSVFVDENERHFAMHPWTSDSDFAIVQMKFIAEHPNYATVKCNTGALEMEIMLPGKSTITVHPNGHYSVDVDKTTRLEVHTDLIQLNQMSQDNKPKCSFSADLSVFSIKKEGRYCQLRDSSGKIFVVEGNSNYYVIEPSTIPTVLQKEHPRVEPLDVNLSDFIASTDLQVRPTSCKGKKLSRHNKYFVMKRDLTAMEILHVDDVANLLNNPETGSLIFTQTLPDTENRCFVLISPGQNTKFRKWEMGTILPNAKYEETFFKQHITSTYGVEPPMWLHPLPKKKRKFVVPSKLTCRVFIETTKTKLSPPPGSLDCYFCEIDKVPEVEHSQISPNEVETYLRQLAQDNQDILREMYMLTAYSIINRKKLKVRNSVKLDRYLKNSKYHVEMKKFYKKSVRFHLIPKYFYYQYGFCWTILNGVLMTGLSSEHIEVRPSYTSFKTDTVPYSSVVSESSSDREIEYDLSVKDAQSFSSLSYRSELSAETAPAILRTVSVKCKVHAVREFVSCPKITCTERGMSLLDSSPESFFGTCEIRQDEIDTLVTAKSEEVEKLPMTLEDLMYLGFV